jgi:UPF0042 nucleotide-binding protein
MKKSRKEPSIAIADYGQERPQATAAATAETVDTPGVLLVTGMSGAGKTSALKSLEDLGFEAIDNVPLSLIGNLVAPAQPEFNGAISRPIAIGVDIRTRDFGARAFLEQLDRLGEAGGKPAPVLFMDCDDEELRRRYTETRHRHPLAQDRPVGDGIALERRLVSPLRERADVVLDTTGLAPGELKGILQGHFGPAGKKALSILVMSFSYRRGIPRQADLVFDVRFLANPHYDPALRPLTGKDALVAGFISEDADFSRFFDGLCGLLQPLLPRYAREGKSYLTIALGCTGGRHRSVFTAEKLAAWLEEEGENVRLNHRDLD